MSWLAPFPITTSNISSREFLMQQIPNEGKASVIPEKAIEAAMEAYYANGEEPFGAPMRAALEAAAPYMLAGLHAELVNLAKDFDTADGGTLAYTSPNGLRKNAHDQLMYIVENYLGEQPHD